MAELDRAQASYRAAMSGHDRDFGSASKGRACRGDPALRNSRRLSWLTRGLLTTVAAVSTSSVASAQTQVDTNAKPATAGTGADSSALQEIIVTAQRRSENLQSVPVTVQSIDANSLAQQNITTGLDIAKLTPGVSVARSSGTVRVYIRGIGNSVDSQGNEPSNALYIDGVYYSRLVANLFRFNNVERVEVLKGPQGTLFGRNAEGGLIQIISRTPVPGSGLMGEINAGYGSYNTFDTSAYLASGLGEKFAADIAVSFYNNDGFGRNVVTGAKASYEKSRAARTKIVFEPQDGTRFILSADYSKSNTDLGIPGQKPGSPFPGGANTGLPDGSGLLPRIGYYDSNTNSRRNYYAEQYGGSFKIEQDIGFAKLLSISAYHKNNELYSLDSDFGPQNVGLTSLPGFTKQFTQEIQAQSNSGTGFVWTVGAFYLNIKAGFREGVIRGPAYGPPGSGLRINSTAPLESYAGYGQATVTLLPKLKFTLGARISDDHIKGNGSIALQFDAGPRITAVPYAEAKTSETRVTGKGVLSYQATDDVLAYISASRGYKSGLYNILTFSPVLVKPEILDAFEGGIKSELFDKTLRLNGAIFYNRFKNPQVQVVALNSLLSLVNAGRARTYGAEIDAEWVATSALSITASGSYLNAKYTDFRNAPFYTPNPVSPYGVLGPVSGNADGNTLPRSPKFSGNAGFLYKIPVADGRFLLSGNYAYSSKFFWTPENRDKQSAYGLFDGRVAYEFKNGLTLSVWCSNITGKKYQTAGQTQPGNGGDFGDAGAPRQYGATANFKF